MVENLSQGGALLGADANLRGGQTGRLGVAEAQVSYRVLSTDKSGTHLQFADPKPAEFEQALARLSKGAPVRKPG
jgi:hypothetical protein